MIPITFGFNQSLDSLIGKCIIEDNKFKMVFNQNSRIKIQSEDIHNRVFLIEPGYIITKQKDGVILEAELVELSVVIGPGHVSENSDKKEVSAEGQGQDKTTA